MKRLLMLMTVCTVLSLLPSITGAACPLIGVVVQVEVNAAPTPSIIFFYTTPRTDQGFSFFASTTDAIMIVAATDSLANKTPIKITGDSQECPTKESENQSIGKVTEIVSTLELPFIEKEDSPQSLK